VRAAKPATPASRAATVGETAGSGNATPKSDMMSDLPHRFHTRDGLTKQVSSKRRGYTDDDLDPRIVTAAKAAATRIRSLIAEIAEETVRREIRIGRELLAIKARLGHGHFGPWLAAEFGWSDRQARRFMSAARGEVPYPGALAEDVDAYMTDPPIAEHLARSWRRKSRRREYLPTTSGGWNAVRGAATSSSTCHLIDDSASTSIRSLRTFGGLTFFAMNWTRPSRGSC
jgi:hypothetical protein